MKTIRIYNRNNYEIRTETINNVEYMVVPVVMMREGVHNGSHGPIYHNPEELGRYVLAWNGIPVVVTHPQQDGIFVSANSPQIREQYAVGTIYNAHMDGDRLKADAFILQTDLERISPETLAMITNGDALDVSVGVFSDQIEEQGVWNGETYTSRAENYRPDHLALLPHEQGACNWQDGCGIRNNSSNKNENANETSMDLKVFKAKSLEMNPPLIANQDYVERQRNISSMMDAMDVWEPEAERRIHYLKELYETYFIYKVNMSGETKYFRQNYQMDASNTVELVGDPVEVRREVTYTPVAPVTMRRTKKNGKLINQTEGNTMTLEEKVDKLINHSAQLFCNGDRATLLAMSEEKVDGFLAKADVITNASKEEPAKPATPQANASQEPKKEEPVSMETYLQSVPAEMRDQVTYGLQLHANQRQGLIDQIQANAKDLYTKEELVAMSTPALEKIAKLAVPAEPAQSTQQQINYGVFGGARGGEQPQVNTDDVPVMLPTGMAEENKG